MTTEETGQAAMAMQGRGDYNRNSVLQAANLTSALPFFAAAAATVLIEGADAIVIADYGASQGRNSLPPMRAALQALRARAGEGRPVQIIHTDLPSNDFAALFTMLDEDAASYTANDKNVFALAVGRSFYTAVLPSASVHLGWSSNALHWMSRNPVNVPDHGWAIFSASAAAREAVEQRLADDWRDFLLARAAELRVGAKLVCQFMGRGPDSHGFEFVSNALWRSITDMAQAGLLTQEELLHMTSPAAGRSVAQVQAPFANGLFAGLSLDYVNVVQAPDPYWDVYQRSGDATQLGTAWASMMRAVHGPFLASALAPTRDKTAYLDDLFARLAAHIAASPQRSSSYNMIVVIGK